MDWLGPGIPDRLTAARPTVLWVELTSRCVLDCLFCTRRERWGSGRDMDLALYRRLMQDLDQPEMIRLNYSGESLLYPQLAAAIELAAETGACTELVTALPRVSDETIRQLARSRLQRLTVSLHTLDSAQYARVYGTGQLASALNQLQRLIRLRAAQKGGGPNLDLCMVAMRENLSQMEPLAAFAVQAGISRLNVLPVIARGRQRADFAWEHRDSCPTPPFREELLARAAQAAAGHPETELTVDLPAGAEAADATEQNALREGMRIASCPQNPWNTTHVLANGDLVPCEVQDDRPMGSLAGGSLEEAWHSREYRRFRKDYWLARDPRCRACPWKTVYDPGAGRAGISAPAGRAQLLHGWYTEEKGQAVWSRPKALLVLAGNRHRPVLRLAGILPFVPGPEANRLSILCNGHCVGEVRQPDPEQPGFERRFPLPRSRRSEWLLEFSVRHRFRPSRYGPSKDHRDLGFALIQASLTER